MNDDINNHKSYGHHCGLGSGYIKRTLSFVFFILAIFLVVLTINSIKEYKFIGSGIGATNIITVSGDGEVFAVPDIAEFSFSVVEERKVVKEAQNVAAEKINTITVYLKENDIEEKDIKTTNYSVYPRYEFEREACPLGFNCPPGKQVLKGFEVNQSISVKVRDTEKAGEILSGIGELGVSNISGLNFTIDDEDELKKQAREIAIKDAKEKAKQLAKDLGIKLVRIVNFSESGNMPYYKNAVFAEEMMITGAGRGGIAPEIPVGENKISSSVLITYEIR